MSQEKKVEFVVTKHGICPKHGKVKLFTVASMNEDNETVVAQVSTCPHCYVDWIGTNVPHLTPIV